MAGYLKNITVSLEISLLIPFLAASQMKQYQAELINLERKEYIGRATL